LAGAGSAPCGRGRRACSLSPTKGPQLIDGARRAVPVVSTDGRVATSSTIGLAPLRRTTTCRA
jgi:hypothetical protein